jgi:hypothetical protein
MKRFAKYSIGLILPVIIISGSFVFVPDALAANAALSLSPSTGTFVVDSTFDVSIFLDTGGQSINAVELGIKFSPDKLQLVSSSTGKSIIGIWPSLPKFNNQTGTVELTGGIPNGATVSKGLVSTLTFRAKAVGSTVVKIEHSKVLSNDGSGTEIATQNNNSVYQIILPPPAGPIIASDTHPDQNVWYKEKNVSLKWGDEGGIEGFSYMISDLAVDTPDDIVEGTAQSVVYRNLSDGRHYFHIKGLRNGQWGGVSHYAINVDATPPAQYKIEIIPGAKTARKQPVIQFATTDGASGMNHYEIKIVPLQPVSTSPGTGQILFIEATSPFVPDAPMDNARYDVIVRAYDQASNFTEVTQKLEIVPAILQNVGDKGLQVRSFLTIPWWVVWTILGLAILILLLIAWLIVRHHRRIHQVWQQPVLPGNLQAQLLELQRYRDKYGQTLLIILALSVSLLVGHSVHAETQTTVLTPPLINSVNKNLTNDELFYAGGFTGVPNAEVILFLQNMETGETQQINTKADDKGEWFYRHNAFLSTGTYELWGQTKVAGQESPPSSQIKILVEKKALQFGGSKFSLPTIYLMIIFVLLAIMFFILLYIFYHYRHIQRKNKLVSKQIQDMEASIRRGFAVLNRDIQAELALLEKTHGRKSQGDLQKEEQLLRDLDDIEQYISKEIWELEESERN